MWQVLFRIPIKTEWTPDGIPIFGYGLMLFLTYFIGVRLAVRRAKAEGVDPEIIQDLAIWLFLGGIVGARANNLIAHAKMFAGHCGSAGEFFDAFWEFLKEFPRIWDGGLILYGSVFGTLATWGILWFFIYRKRNITTLQLADIYAPSIALGVCLGRLGCLCNGCCYGQVACESCPGVGFPLPASARYELTQAGLQTTAGFTVYTEYASVDTVDRGHESKGLEAGDLITRVNGHEVGHTRKAQDLIARARLSGDDTLILHSERGEKDTEVAYGMPSLGFKVDDSRPSLDGPTVRTVVPGSNADRAGLRRGDRILCAAGPDGRYRSGIEIDLLAIVVADLARPQAASGKPSQFDFVVLRRDYFVAEVDLPLFDSATVAVAYEDNQYPVEFKFPKVGFSLHDVETRVSEVAIDSPAFKAGLKRGDVILSVNENDTDREREKLDRSLSPKDNQFNPAGWVSGENELRLKVERQKEEKTLPGFVPRTIPLHPTQIYESISMFLMFLVLLAYTPLRTSYGQVLSVLAIGYAVHRYLNEWLRNDVRPGWFEFAASVGILIVGSGMYVYLWYYPLEIKDPPPAPPEPAKPDKGQSWWKFW